MDIKKQEKIKDNSKNEKVQSKDDNNTCQYKRKSQNKYTPIPNQIQKLNDLETEKTSNQMSQNQSSLGLISDSISNIKDSNMLKPTKKQKNRDQNKNLKQSQNQVTEGKKSKNKIVYVRVSQLNQPQNDEQNKGSQSIQNDQSQVTQKLQNNDLKMNEQSEQKLIGNMNDSFQQKQTNKQSQNIESHSNKQNLLKKQNQKIQKISNTQFTNQKIQKVQNLKKTQIKKQNLTEDEFKSLLHKNEQELKDELLQLNEIKKGLPEIKQLEQYKTLLKLCNNMIAFDLGNTSDHQMRIFINQIFQSSQFQRSIQEILPFFYVLDQLEKKQILQEIAKILTFLIQYLNPIQYEIMIKIYIHYLLVPYKQELNDQTFLLQEQTEIELWLKMQESLKQKTQIYQYQPKCQIPALNEIDTSFDNIDIIPSRLEIIQNIKNTDKFSVVPIKGSYISEQIYLINNFFLLREDFFREIKISLSRQYKNSKFDLYSIDREFQGLFYVYCNSKILDIQFTKQGIFFTINTSPLYIRNKKKYQWEESRRLMNGSLLILTNENFDKFYYLIVKNQTKNINQEFYETNKVTIITELEMDGVDSTINSNLLEDIYGFFLKQNVLMFETKYYWVAYSHFLRCIKTMIFQQKQLPFKNTIIDCKQKVDSPKFINYNTTYTIKINKEKYGRGTNLILIRDSWNTVDKGSLDDSQFECLVNMLTKQVSVIQGPPGTGKTFVGSMAVKVLTDNYHVWNKKQRPILMICKTNHALDQFLNHILKFENKIARIGNRTQDNQLKKYQLGYIRDCFKEKKKKFNTPSLGDLKNVIEEINKLYQNITKQVEDYMLKDDEYSLYEKLKFNLKDFVIESFEKFFGFNLDSNNRSYDKLKEIITQQWWSCCLDFKQLEYFVAGNNQGLLTSNQLEQVKQTQQNWNEKMKKQKKNFLDELKRQPQIDIKQLELQKFLEEQRLKFPNLVIQDQNNEELDSESENEEGYVQNRQEYDIEDQNLMEIDEMKIQNSEFIQIKCKKKQLLELLQKKEKGGLNLFKLEYSQSYNIKAYAVEYLKESTFKKFTYLFQDYYQFLKQYKLELSKDNARILTEMETKIVGMTLNGASMNSQLIQSLQSPIVIIEEAGEVLESLIVPVLQPSTQQLILIGDHQQLKPTINNYDLEKKYKFNTSLLERLFKNEVEHGQLKVQRRMNPEFADYIRLIYENYEDYPALQKVTNVVGMPKNMFLISHSHSEEIISNSTSKKNKYEAQYAVKLAQYLTKQNQFAQEEITILSMYLGQSQLIRKLARQSNLQKVRISSVDNYQGEENEIVILSLVRSNQSKNLGYTKTENRINVSFSRAKKGFYCIGNFNMISQVEDAKLWHKIIDLAKEKQHLVESIYFSCNKHKEITKVTHFNDFDKMPKGGCQKKCNTPKRCGHNCTQSCHPDICENHQCNYPCQRKIDECGHLCKQKMLLRMHMYSIC
ncbi:hypothetical protein ABPG72_014829 [Tetrahymena utriculariae]